jgi:transposase
MAGLEPTDELWERVRPLLPGRTPLRVGRPRLSDRAPFSAMVFVLVTGVPWRMVPRQIGCSGVTAWQRLRECQRARGVGATAQ